MEKPLPLIIHKQDIIDVFPRDKLILLTPHSPNILHEFDPKMYYVISVLVGQSIGLPYAMEKATKLNLQTARIPIDYYINCSSITHLSLGQMLKVMLEVKYSKDWNEAFRYV